MSEDREKMLARRRVLVGSVLSLGEQDPEAVEASFDVHFARNIPDDRFWLAFKEACAAVRAGENWAIPRQLLLAFSLPQQVNGKDHRGETMLTLAAAFGRSLVVNILCQIKGDSSIENAKGWSAVHVAAANNHVGVLKAMINLGVNMDEPDSRLGFAPVHLAASVDHLEVLELLQQSGKVDFLKRARNGLSVLHVAAAHGSHRCATFLSSHFPALLNDQSGVVLHESPAHVAAKHLHPKVYRQLVASGARDDLENIQDDTPSDVASFSCRYFY